MPAVFRRLTVQKSGRWRLVHNCRVFRNVDCAGNDNRLIVASRNLTIPTTLRNSGQDRLLEGFGELSARYTSTPKLFLNTETLNTV